MTKILRQSCLPSPVPVPVPLPPHKLPSCASFSDRLAPFSAGGRSSVSHRDSMLKRSPPFPARGRDAAAAGNVNTISAGWSSLSVPAFTKPCPSSSVLHRQFRGLADQSGPIPSLREPLTKPPSSLPASASVHFADLLSDKQSTPLLLRPTCSVSVPRTSSLLLSPGAVHQHKPH